MMAEFGDFAAVPLREGERSRPDIAENATLWAIGLRA